MESEVNPHLLRMLNLLNDVGYNSMQGGPILTELFLSHFQIKPLILVDVANRVFKTRLEDRSSSEHNLRYFG